MLGFVCGSKISCLMKVGPDNGAAVGPGVTVRPTAKDGNRRGEHRKNKNAGSAKRDEQRSRANKIGRLKRCGEGSRAGGTDKPQEIGTGRT